VKDFFQKHTDR